MNYPRIGPSGPLVADVLIVGEAPGGEEINAGFPFIGVSGQELNKLLAEAGFNRHECRVTNVCPFRPDNNKIEDFMPKKKGEAYAKGAIKFCGKFVTQEILIGLKELHVEIQRANPKLIIALGNTPLWALTGNSGITRWRGSQLIIPVDAPVNQVMAGELASAISQQIKVVPTLHPTAILRSWADRPFAVQDLRRAKRWLKMEGLCRPEYKFIVAPTFDMATTELKRLIAAADFELSQGKHLKLAPDLETRNGHTACIGIADSYRSAICIPLMSVDNPWGYWSCEEELEIISLLESLLCHPGVQIVGQNFLYDMQYIIKHWLFWPDVHMDTMIAHHTCFPGTDKGLHILSSLYCEFHEYWKEEGKLFNPRYHSEERLWVYNCKDCCATLEVSDVLERTIDKINQREQYEFQMSMFQPILQMMVGGMLYDVELQKKMAADMAAVEAKYEELLEYWIGTHVGNVKKGAARWYKSNKQLATLFYDQFGCKVIKHRKTKKATTDEQALQKFKKQMPILGPLTDALGEYRSVETYTNTFLLGNKHSKKKDKGARPDIDNRMRCYYNIAGPETFRFSSTKNAFGSGMNLQNIPGEDEEAEMDKREIKFPNIKLLFKPDPGHTLLDWDLKQADAQVVAWEAEDEILKALFRDKSRDMHTENAIAIFGSCTGEGDHRRYLAKRGVHLTNYGGTAYVLAASLNISLSEAEHFQASWFAAHPRIREWHEQVTYQLASKRTVFNKFGNRRVYFDRPQVVLKEALAWIPQSTVALTIDRGMMNIINNLPYVRVLMQVHDSLVMQVPSEMYPACLPEIKKQLCIPIPYKDPLIIPPTCKASDKSWGECQKVKVE